MNNNNDRSWNDNFKAYTEYIVNHKNYAGLPYERGKNGCVKWVVAGKSKQGIALLGLICGTKIASNMTYLSKKDVMLL